MRLPLSPGGEKSLVMAETAKRVALGTLIVIAVKDSDLGLPAAIVYALAFTVEFGLLLAFYAGGGTRGR